MEGGKGDDAARRRASRCRQIKEKLKGTFTFSLVLSLAIHLAMVIIGAVKIDECPVQRNIPVYLVAAGVLGIVSKILSFWRDAQLKFVKMSTILTIIFTAELLYFIYGSYWIYKEYKPNYSPASGLEYCNKTVYIFAITYVSIVYCFIVLFLIGLLCCICTILACDLACEKCLGNLDIGEEESVTESRGTQTR